MKKVLLISFLWLNVFNVNAQFTMFSTFEDLFLPVDSFENGRNLNGYFISGNIQYMNQYTDWGGGFESFTGFVYSNMTDTITPGYVNSFSCMSGSGQNGSSNYAIFYENYQNTAMKFNVSVVPIGFYINNSTYAYYSMRDGDGIGKKFGGASGNDPDYFKLNIYNYSNGSISDTVQFYLADYRFANNSLDYIVKEWTFVDLSSFGNSDSISFGFASSDTGSFGINTPSYFCMDNFSFYPLLSYGKNDVNKLAPVFPNPVINYIELNYNTDHYNIYDLQGKLILSENNLLNKIADVSQLPSGLYIIKQLKGNTLLSSQKLVKH